jgi:predicted nucleotidyltransferase
MGLTSSEKEKIKKQVAERLSLEEEVRRVVVFGSFLESEDPRDIDIAVFQDSTAPYLPLAVKYRRRLAPVADRIPIDVIPIRPDPQSCTLLEEINKGEVIYER